jgi:hypothetical protein
MRTSGAVRTKPGTCVRDVTDHPLAHPLAAECDRLIALADAMPAVAERRRAIAATWYAQLLELTQAAALESGDGERALDALTAQLRRSWMGTAHEHADATYRSPAAGERKVLPSRTTMAYGYERSLEVNPLESRLPAYRPVPAGWCARHLLFSSGMAALSGVMQALPAIVAAGPHRPSLLAAAAYFETLDLLELGTHGCTTRVVSDDAAFGAAIAESEPDVAFVEPIVYDPWLRPFDVRRAAHALARLDRPPVLVVDSTLVGPALPFARILDEARDLPLVVHASSGLKLDQAGLELANVGIVSLYAPERRRAELDAAAGRLSSVRRLNGTSLTVDVTALLDVPFFLDPAPFYDYCTAVFANNARLARAVPAGRLFTTVAHPSLDERRLPWAQAPFVFFHLREDETERYDALDRLVVDAAAARGLALERGGSFGFRGHRCEAIALADGPRNGVFKVALGARSGPSADGIVALLREIAAYPTVGAAADALGARRRPAAV